MDKKRALTVAMCAVDMERRRTGKSAKSFFNPATREWEEIPFSEIMKMLQEIQKEV